ncbi:uncharacterized protein LOC132952450 [Metopolophium dirhodum]|uniref:uncharacterized protein LOC132952450 n=1 Tax=Metopolophium dirhodum TaxID=44670 RepID=UPI0029902C15|nr:uncharacterized protein LOC132952450 [Metopolophium dirhodum]
MDGLYEDESDDENLIRVVTSLLSFIGMDTASSGDVQSPGSDPEKTCTTIPDDAPLEDPTGKDDENEEHFEVLHSQLPSGDALSLAESEPAAQIPETAPLGYTVQEDDGSSVDQVESIVSACSYSQSGGDAPPSELGTVDRAPTSEGGYLDNVVMPAAAEDVLCADIEQPAKELAVMDSIGELIGEVDPAVEREKRVFPRRRSTWKRVKRVFRVLFCCRCETVRS